MMDDEQVHRVNLGGALGVLLVAAVITAFLLLSQSDTPEVIRATPGEQVTVVEAQRALQVPRINAQGTVIPARQVTIRPQVSGRVIERHSGLVNGGAIQAGEVLFRVDPRDYEIALEEARTAVEVARAELSMEEGRQVVAKEEWERFGTAGEDPPPLALREPQLRQAELEISRAQQRVQRATLELDRTRIRADFTGLVLNASVEVGEIVSPSLNAATLVALDEFWVQASVPLEAVGLLAIPGRDGDVGSKAIIRHQSGESFVEHRGEVIRLLGDLDPAGRMARVLIRVEDPFSLSDQEQADARPDRPALRRQPLMLGSYVSVELEGAEQRFVIEVPRQAIHEGRYVYIANRNDRLERREVQFAWRNRDTVAINTGISPGERVILSGMPAPVEGMPLRVQTLGELQSPKEPGEEPAQEEEPLLEPLPDNDGSGTDESASTPLQAPDLGDEEDP